MNLKKRIKIFLFKYLLPEYALMPWKTAVVKINGKDCQKTFGRPVLGAPVRQLTTYFFKTTIEEIYDEPEISKEIWNILDALKPESKALVRYRFSRIHNDVLGGRELQSEFISIKNS